VPLHVHESATCAARVRDESSSFPTRASRHGQATLRETIIPARARSLLSVPDVFSNANSKTNEEDFMPAATSRTKRSDKGLLTPDNCVIALIDHQPQMMFGVAGVDRQSIITNTVALAKAARVFDVPVVLTTVETKSFSGNLWPQIRAVFPEQAAIERSSMNAWDDKNFVAAIKATGRKKIVLAGLWTEVCVAFPSVQAIHDGYEVYVVEDCCGDVSQLAHDNAMKRVIQAGAKPVTSLQVMLEFQRDWAEKDTYDAVMDIVKTHYGAYGVGVEYVYTMVHHAPPTVFPAYVIPPAASRKKSA
jgi:nicotinamidase-related amidase